MKELAIVIGRFQPFHNGHKYLIEQALKLAKRVLVCIGSADSPRTIRNPWTYAERWHMIHGSFGYDEQNRLQMLPVEDCLYDDDVWVHSIQSGAHPFVGWGADKVVLVGHSKDETSFYLKLFPTWEVVEVNPPWKADLSSTQLRANYFGGLGWKQDRAVLPPHVFDYLGDWSKTPEYKNLVLDFKAVCDYEAKYGLGPFNTVDALVTAGDYILLVQRSTRPGLGLWALPGGFIGHNEKLIDATLRELKEETGLVLSKGQHYDQYTFDDPNRSQRARLITTCFAFASNKKKLKAGDDAADAKWFHWKKIKRNMMFEDHYDIIKHMRQREEERNEQRDYR